MDETTLKGIKTTLESERASVEHQLSEYGAAIDGERVELPMDEGGFADSAQSTAERSELLSLVEGLRSHHAEITGALRRIEEGTYGRCESCGGAIPPERLEARPTARLCLDCKQSAA